MATESTNGLMGRCIRDNSKMIRGMEKEYLSFRMEDPMKESG
jgi:hypothetical protein